MFSSQVAVVSILLTLVGAEELVFPPGFKFGAASSAYQIEGAWNVSDKTESIWDRALHTLPWMSTDGTNGDVACDSYHLWQRDIEMAEELGLKFYRFSLSWTRLLPNGFANKISEDGKNYYDNLINGLLEKGIEPLVTIYHWDLPQSLQDLGGWTNPLISDWFKDYARVVYSLYADRVKTWITINEPVAICDTAYSMGTFAPGIIHLESVYLCSKNVLLAHAKAWRVYDEEYKPLYHGKLSICNHWVWFEAHTEDDEEAAELSRQYSVGRYTHAIYSNEGGWPPAIEERLNAYNVLHGYSHPRLPPFTDEEKELVKGTYDYYGFNYYFSLMARRALPGETITPHYVAGIRELGIVMEAYPDLSPTLPPAFYKYPEGLRKHISWIREKYGDLELMIAENGFYSTGKMNDFDRMDYMHDCLEQMLLAITEDGANVTGYSYWSLMDSFEWNESGLKFGLYHVDFNSTERTRSARASADYYKTVIKNHALHSPRP
ncbi:myrosinase 1 [Manduca sexta]|uniref:myrosinase 1 n=1 Tax=Manduca sexta TaxID=7130 RepID=UPI0018909C75|nr:myrosinase 1 [Manduca sexta]